MGKLTEVFEKMDQKAVLKEVMDALLLIIKHCEDVTLNYCVNYAKYAIVMIVEGHSIEDIHHQVCYVVNNFDDWTGRDAQTSKSILNKFANVK